MTNKESRQIISALKERFINGEKLPVKEIIEDYFAPKGAYAFLVARDTVRRYLQNIKHSLRKKEGIWFGCLNNEGIYGIATTKEEVIWAAISYYKLVKGNIASVQILASNAKANKILPDWEQTKLLMPFIRTEENENKNK